MRHSVNIMFGKQTADCLLALNKYVLRMGSKEIDNYYRSYMFSIEDTSVDIMRVECVDDEYKLVQKEKWRDEDIVGAFPRFVQDVHRQMITIHNRGDYANIHLCLYVPLVEDIKKICSYITAIEKGGFNYVDIDVICLAGDICKNVFSDYDIKSDLLDLQKQTGDSLKVLAEYRRNHPILQHLVVIQDYQNGGAALSLQLNSLTRLLGELALMMIENYMSVFGNVRSEADFQTLGLSMLQLDKFYLKEYMLRRTLQCVAEREKIRINKVDINSASKRATDLLNPWLKLLSQTYRKVIKVSLDRRETEADIVAKTDAYLQEQFGKMREQLESYITDDELSLPEKKAILSAILGQDDELFVNDLYDENVLSIGDLERESIEEFVSTNNYILSHEDRIYDALLSDNAAQAYFPIDEMRKNRIKLRRTIGYIRELEKEQVRLKEQMHLQEHSTDSFIENGEFTIGERKFKLLPHVDEVPLQEQYTPHATTATSVDLSGMMPKVKDQGAQGACLAFSLTSVFEYLYKRKTGEKIDLSEQFLYYNARLKAGQTEQDCGSVLNFAVESLSEYGLCTEQKWQYGLSETAYNIRPSEDAYTDAKERLVADAKNVALNIDAIRSALSDGYPVVFSTKLYDSFGKGHLGFVSMPSTEEREQADETINRNHAMVICGYNDEAHAFKVRNSWGTSFGIGGYVMMPYAYITDSSLTNYAAILTDIKLAETITEKVIQRPQQPPIPHLEFDKNDAETQYGINRILLDEARIELRELEQKDMSYSTYCLNMKQKLKNPNIRQQMRKSAYECYRTDIEEKQQAINKLINDKSDEMSAFERHEHRTFIKYGLVAVLMAVFFIVTAVLDHKYTERSKEYKKIVEKCEKNSSNGLPINSVIDPSSKKNVEITVSEIKVKIEYYSLLCRVLGWCHRWWLALLCYSLTGIVFLIFFIKYKRAKRELIEMYDEKIGSASIEKGALEKNMNELGIKFHLAGSMLTYFFNMNDALETKSRILTSFMLNVRSLTAENDDKLNSMSPDVQPPFIPVLKNDDLDKFFANKGDDITKDTHLYKFFEGYTVDEEAFSSFRKLLEKHVDEITEQLLNDFSIYKYMSRKQQYLYLTGSKMQITDYLVELDEKSEVFMLCNNTIAINPSKTLFVHIDANEDFVWQNTYRRAFSIPPVCINIESRFKIILLRLLDMNMKQIEWYN